jgi:hypothetical protein
MSEPVVMEGRKVRDFGDYFKYNLNKGHVLNKERKCKKCGLYGCVCQISLKEWVEPVTRRELFHKEEVYR